MVRNGTTQDTAGGQKHRRPEKSFRPELKIERHAIQGRIPDYIKCGIHGRHCLYNLSPLGGHRISEVIDQICSCFGDGRAAASANPAGPQQQLSRLKQLTGV
jgi:hypothetical protein